LFTNPSLALGEAYTNGTRTVKDADLYDFLDLIGRNMEISGLSHLKETIGWINWLLRRLQQWNRAGRSRFNAARHYNLSGALYDMFPDADKQYSCAYFPTPGTGLDEIQEAKKCLIATKLILEPGHKVLDIGSGWSGMAIYLARETCADVTGLTLSAEQLKVSRQRTRDAGLSDRVRFHHRDYRDQTGVFDRFGKYFLQVRDPLTADGVALVRTISRVDSPGVTDPWIHKYVFPGGYIPALLEIMPAIK
jgi:cyclopropane-fatty-acyl-phospholipid synthase